MSYTPEATEQERVRLWNEVRGLKASPIVEKAATDTMRIERDEAWQALRKIIAEDDTGPMTYEARQVGLYTVSQAVGGSEGRFAAIARAALSNSERTDG